MTGEQQTLDPDLVGRYALTTWGYKQGEMVALMIHLGTRLGLYEALDGAGPVTSGDLAAATGLHERPRASSQWPSELGRVVVP